MLGDLPSRVHVLSPPPAARDAARNNAELCAIVSAAHGVDGVFATDAWTSPEPHSPALPRRRDAGARGLGTRAAHANRHGPGSVSEGQLRRPRSPLPRVRDPVLGAVDHPGTGDARGRRFVGADHRRRCTRRVDRRAGVSPTIPPICFVPHSSSTRTSRSSRPTSTGTSWPALSSTAARTWSGLSNVFVTTAAPDDVWPGCLDAITRTFPGVPIVGYEPGESLDTALHYGFTALGPLRVWIKPG